jgi:hypothetical protein
MARRRPILLTGTLTLAVLASACGGGADEVETQSGQEPTTAGAPSSTEGSAPAEAPAVWPLRGDEAGDGDVEAPAVVVKIDNDPHARPQSGLNQADVVYEIEVEGITRFAAMFHSTEVEQVGPIRSARSSDIDVIAALGRPLFAWSGANGGVTAEVNAAQDAGLLVNVGQDAALDQYWRDNTRYAPYNLYSSITGLRDLHREGTGTPHALFAYRGSDDELPASTVPTSGIAVGYRGDGRISNVEFVWDPDLEGWARFQTDNLHGDGSPHVDAAGEQIAPENVVVLYTNYAASVADSRSPQAQTIGEGDALVLTGDGQAVAGRWSRGANTDGVTLTSPEGDEIALTPGRTWVLLPQPGHVGPMTPDRASYLLTLT